MGELFSIYKISIFRLYQFLQENKIDSIDGKDISFYNNEYKQLSIDEQGKHNRKLIEKYIINAKKGLSIIKEINSESYLGFYYKSDSYPTWNSLIDSLIGQKVTQPNVNYSYVLFIFIKNIIFSVCGNSGSGRITQIYERDFGLRIIPKIMNDNDAVIRDVAEKVPRGIASSNTRSNRYKTPVINELNYEKYFKALTLETTSTIMKELGFDDEDESNITKIIAKDAFHIHRSISFEVLLITLEKITKIIAKEDRFSLWYLTPAIKVDKRYGKETLDNVLYNLLLDGKFDIFEILPDSFFEYNTQIANFELHDETGKCITKKNILFNSFEIFDSVTKLSISKIRMIFNKYKIIGQDSSNSSLFEYPIKDISNALIEYDNRTFYLVNNEWYTLEKSFIEFLNDKFKEITKAKEDTAKNIINKFNLTNKENENEADYNKSFDHTNSISVDRKQISRVELADIILWDEDNLYLLHNKLKFNGTGSRDLSNQIITSASILFNSKNKDVLSSYYKKINTKKLDEEGFIKLFDKNIVYLAGYLFDFKIESDSTYAKYLSVLTNQHVQNCKFEFYVLNLENKKDE